MKRNSWVPILAAALLVATVLAAASGCRQADGRSDAETVARLKAELAAARSEAKRLRERAEALMVYRGGRELFRITGFEPPEVFLERLESR